MTRRKAFRNGAALLGLMSLAIAAPAAVTVSRVEYHGWKDCWRVSNGTVELVVVPQIGRIMRFGFLDGPNVLWENPSLLGKVDSGLTKDWVNYGGDKLWPAPQKDWNWPPDPILDRGELSVRATAQGLILHGKPSGGLVFEREIKMDPSEGVVTVLNRLTNNSAKPIDKSVWEICQTDSPDEAVLPVDKTPEVPAGWIPLSDPKGLAELIKPVGEGETIKIQRDPKEGRKVGSTSHDGTVSIHKGDLMFNLSTFVEAGGIFPDGGCPQEVFLSADPLPYDELELLGPIRHLTAGQSTSIEVRWELTKLPKN